MSKYTNSIIITTINAETEAISQWKKIPNARLIIVGDSKTPDYLDHNIQFLPFSQQSGELASLIPANSYSRKNLGYLEAIKSGSTTIYETDDDTLPYDSWCFPAGWSCGYGISSSCRVANIYGKLSGKKIWNRGFPLEYINEQINYREYKSFAGKDIGIWQTLIDGDADVDAIYRLTNNEHVKFDLRNAFSLGVGTYSPFNSQSTFWSQSCFLYMYFPSTVSWRFADILRSYVAQRLMWGDHLHLGFLPSSVFQERIRTDYLRDLVDEYSMYANVGKVLDILDRLVFSGDAKNRLHLVYSVLVEEGIVQRGELLILEAWIRELDKVVLGG